MEKLNKPATSNKFSSPLHHTENLLPRFRLISQHFPVSLTQKRFIILEARAGQGKTTFAHQLLHHHKQESMWYRINLADNDPIFFLTSLHQCITLSYEAFCSNQFTEIIHKGALSPPDIKKIADILFQDIQKFLQSPVFLVLDDFHKLDISGQTHKLIAHIIDTCPDSLHFVINTRSPIHLQSKALLNQSSIVYLDTDDLALSQHDIQTLIHDIFKQGVTPFDVLQIYRITQGWIMGVILATHPFQSRKQNTPFYLSIPESIQSHHQLLTYFQDEILSDIPEPLHEPFLKLSLLEEIPADFAKLVTGDNTIDRQLHQLVQDNSLLSLHEDSDTVYSFHQLFQEFLQFRAGKMLDNQTINKIYRQEANYYLSQNRLAKGIECYLKGKEFQLMNETLKNEWITLLSQNRTFSIYTVLEKIPYATLKQYEWLSLITGIILADFAPKESLPFLEAAASLFQRKNDEKGKLISLAQIVYHHFVIAGRYQKGSEILPQIEELYLQQRNDLDPNIRMMILRSLASGFCFFNGDMEKAITYSTEAVHLATRNQSKNFIASTRFILGYIELLSGNFENFLREAEKCSALLSSPLVGTSNKLTIRMVHLCYLSMTGDLVNFELQKETLLSNTEQELIQQTIAGPYLELWTGISFLNAEKNSDALTFFKNGNTVSSTAKTKHLSNQLLQWQCYSQAKLNGHSKDIFPALTESERLREEACSPYYRCINQVISGATLFLLGMHSMALEKLTTGTQLAEKHGFLYWHAASLLHRSLIFLQDRNHKDASSDLKTAMKLMTDNNLEHFWSVTPTMWSTLLSFCKKNQIAPQHAFSLEQKQTTSFKINSGKQLPILEVTVLKGFSIKINGRTCLMPSDLTQQQRQVLGILIAVKNHQISIDSIQLQLWPDSPPEKARKNFDALIERLRKKLSDHLGIPIKHYLILSKRILSLINVKIDAPLFLQYTVAGIRESKKNNWWQAGNFFNKALSLWGKTLPTHHFSGIRVSELERDIVSSLRTITKLWGSYLLQNGSLNEAAKIFENTWTVNIHDEELIGKLYSSYHAENNKRKCWQTIDRYRESLIQYGYTDREIEAYCDKVIEYCKT